MVKIRFANIKLVVNGKVISTQAEPFIYNGNVYAPVATVANMLGIHQQWDNATPAVRFADRAYYEIENPLSMGERAAGTRRLDHEVVMTYAPGADEFANPYYQLHDSRKKKTIQIPSITSAGYISSFEPVSSFINITGQSNTEFVIHEYLFHQQNRDQQQWVSIFRYDKGTGTLTKVISQRIDEGEQGSFQVSVAGGIVVKFYQPAPPQAGQPTLAGVKFYRWDPEQRKIMKTEQVVK